MQDVQHARENSCISPGIFYLCLQVEGGIADDKRPCFSEQPVIAMVLESELPELEFLRCPIQAALDVVMDSIPSA
jgi:hypothetical protein